MCLPLPHKFDNSVCFPSDFRLTTLPNFELSRTPNPASSTCFSQNTILNGIRHQLRVEDLLRNKARFFGNESLARFHSPSTDLAFLLFIYDNTVRTVEIVWEIDALKALLPFFIKMFLLLFLFLILKSKKSWWEMKNTTEWRQPSQNLRAKSD